MFAEKIRSSCSLMTTTAPPKVQLGSMFPSPPKRVFKSPELNLKSKEETIIELVLSSRDANSSVK